MSSQEEYLDSLLKDLNINDITPGADELQDFSEEDIDKLILEGSGQNEVSEAEHTEDSLADTDDILKLLDDSGDSDLQEIHDLLEKSENNEPVEDTMSSKGDILPVEDTLTTDTLSMDDLSVEDILSGLEAAGADMSEEAGVSEEAAMSEETDMAEESVSETKKRDKRAQREARKAERNAQKAERKARKEAKKAKKAEAVQSEEEQQIEEVSSVEGLEEDSLFANADDLLNIPELDEIVKEEPIQPTQRQKGFWEKLLDFFMEEDEEDEENEEIKLSEENKEILKEMDKEKAAKKKKSAKKKKAASEENAEESAEGKKEKKKKAKKKKDMGKEVPMEEEADSAKKLSPKKIIPIALVCLSIGAAVIILSSLSAGFMSKREGRKAYYSGDYTTCYQNLFGKDLNESEQVMLHKSESILRIRLWLREYELLAAEGSEVEALDSLIQSVNDYPSLFEFSAQWNASGEVAEAYTQILAILSDKYHLTEEQAKEIGAVPDDVEYTRIVTDIAGGTSFAEQNNQESLQEAEHIPEETIPDRLPEEEETPGEDFVDNHMQ